MYFVVAILLTVIADLSLPILYGFLGFVISEIAGVIAGSYFLYRMVKSIAPTSRRLEIEDKNHDHTE